MDVKEAIEERRSIRKYQNKEVPEHLIRELIEVVRLAPSGNNAQPTKCYIVKDVKTKSELKEQEIFYQDFVYEAPVIIVCCADPTIYKKRIGGWDDPNEIRAMRDLSIASSFLVLRATELDLGTCYVGSLKKDKIKEILNIPQKYLIPYVITVGYPAEKPESTPRKNIDEIIF